MCLYLSLAEENGTASGSGTHKKKKKNGRTGQVSMGRGGEWIRFDLLMLIHPALGFLKSHLIRLTFRVTDLIRFALYGFYGPSAAR